MTHRRRLPLALLVVGDASALLGARPDVSALRQLIASPSSTVATLGPDRTVLVGASALLWLLAAWVAVGMVAVIGSVLPGAVGRGCRALAGVAVPAVARRVVLTALGIGLVAGPAVTATAATATATATPSSSHARVGASAHHDTASGPVWPSDPTPSRASSPGRHARAASQVTVEPGDSLWLIAAHRLGGAADPDRIAAYWPRVYAANTSLIGADPDVIVPGTVLHLPATS